MLDFFLFGTSPDVLAFKVHVFNGRTLPAYDSILM